MNTLLTGKEKGLVSVKDRILLYGDGQISDETLIGFLLGNHRFQKKDEDLAQSLIKESGGLRKLSRKSGLELLKRPGVGTVRAAKLFALFSLFKRLGACALNPGARIESSQSLFEHYSHRLRDHRKECFYVILLDNKNRILKEELVSEGSLTASIVHPREVFAAAIRESAAAIIALHNHPSGDPSPSKEDYEITQRLKQIGELLGIRLLDHVVMGEGSFVSFREQSLLEWK